MTDLFYNTVKDDSKIAISYLKSLAKKYESNLDKMTSGEALKHLNRNNFDNFLSSIDQYNLFEVFMEDNSSYIGLYKGLRNNEFVRNFLLNYGIIGDTSLYKCINRYGGNNNFDDTFTISVSIDGDESEFAIYPGIYYNGKRFEKLDLNSIPFEDLRLFIAAYSTTFQTGE